MVKHVNFSDIVTYIEDQKSEEFCLVSQNERKNSQVILETVEVLSKREHSPHKCITIGTCDYQAFTYENRVCGYLVVDRCCKNIYCVFSNPPLHTTIAARLLAALNSRLLMKSPFVFILKDRPIEGRISSKLFSLYQESVYQLDRMFNLCRIRHPDYQVLLIGHSVGAVFALFYSINLVSQNIKPKIIVSDLPTFSNNEFLVSLLSYYMQNKITICAAADLWKKCNMSSYV